MINGRKIVVWLGALVSVLVVYMVFNMLVDTPEIQIKESDPTSRDIQIPESDLESQRIGETSVESAGTSQYVEVDPVTKEVKRIFGFEELLNPDEGSELWQLKAPYMTIYEKSYECNITAKHGSAEVEKVAGRIQPKDSSLQGNVEIRILSKDIKRPGESIIYLDDLAYSSERSEFTTDGPVKLVSPDAEMEGTGMMLIYNAQQSRLEFFEIKDLDYLRIYKLADTSEKDNKIPQESSAAKSQVEKSIGNSLDSKETESKIDTVADEQKSAKEQSEIREVKKELYQCKISKNVVVEYGRRLVVVGADDVTINNIVWTNRSAKEDKEKADNETVTSKSESAAMGSSVSESDKSATSEGSIKKEESRPVVEAGTDVVVRCQGGVIVRPMDAVIMNDSGLSIKSSRTIEVNGKPVRIKEREDDSSEGVTIARCGILRYDIDSDTMDMFTTDHEKYVALNMGKSDGSVQTMGSVKWERRAGKAVVNGPGQLLMGSKKTETEENGYRSSMMNFDGVMQLFFANEANRGSYQELNLKNVYLAGGMEAMVLSVNPSYVSADSAEFAFDNGNDITEAQLDGNVVFNSDDGELNSENAIIHFAKDDNGDTYATSVESIGEPKLMSKKITSDDRPAQFHAKRIDYDLVSGNAVAQGPVKFLFFIKSTDKDNPYVDTVPIIITAEKNAEFFSGKNLIVFNENVIGVREEEKSEFKQTSTVKGDKLIVELLDSQRSGQSDISNVSIVGDEVMLESVHSVGDVTVKHIRLECAQVDYDAISETVIATGPGDINVNNENAPVVKNDKGRLSLEGPCYASINGFDKLIWSTANNTVQADSKSAINLGYLPIENGQLGKVVRGAARHVEGSFKPTALGQNELVNLTITGGVSYSETDGNIFEGDYLYYDAENSLMTVTGSEAESCMLNGARVSRIKYNLETGKVESDLSVTPGAVIKPR